jgi:hypothetical protein
MPGNNQRVLANFVGSMAAKTPQWGISGIFGLSRSNRWGIAEREFREAEDLTKEP